MFILTTCLSTLIPCSTLLSHLLYGTSTFHRSLAPGFLFALEPNGTYFQILHSFAPLHPDFV
ncbi:hypothetical protein [Chthonomonas calidirosea]|uniref:hypothetical protein n=1 Tax=Chthonomonas calidirosea TaxID=454171 RepID=UPI0012E38BE4|nr:hypothetical protein [Chthonomonas calidirosea]